MTHVKKKGAIAPFFFMIQSSLTELQQLAIDDVQVRTLDGFSIPE